MSRYVRLYAKEHVDQEELEVYLADLRNQIENPKLLIGSVEADSRGRTARTAEKYFGLEEASSMLHPEA
jgi:hypothetical protein